MKEKGDDRIKAATFFTTLVDFTDPGELGVFIDEEQLAAMERSMAKRGYLDGAEMATTFNMLRATDLIWSFVINNYLLGKDPFPFDLLYWNSDSTRMPAAMHSFYLRRCYHENALVQPGAVCLGEVPIDLRRIDLPVYWVSTARGPHRTLEEHLRRDPDLPRPGAGSCSPAPATSPAWSTRRPRASTATGPTPSCRPIPRPGLRARRTTRAPGGTTGRPGTPAMPARWCRPASPATAS